MKNFLFDLYGTLADIRTDEQSAEFWRTVSKYLKSGGTRSVKERYAELCAERASDDGREFDLAEVFEILLKEFGADCTVSEFAQKFRLASVCRLRLFDGVRELLTGLRVRGAKVYLLSNAQACFTRPELARLGISDMFDGIMLSSEIGYKKPSEKFFEGAFKKFSLDPADCLYIGNDLRDDVEGARNAGMHSVYIESEQSGVYGQDIAVDMFAENRIGLKRLLFRLAEEG